VIRGEMPLKAHAHRADDIYTAIRIAKEFGLELRIDHTTDGALIADDLAKEGYPVAVGPSFGHATKYELKNKGFHTPAILAKAGCQVSIITDSPVIEERFLPLCAGRAVYCGLSEFQALQAITINAAKHIGAEDRVGSIEEGKDADFVLVKGTPFAVDTRILYTIIDGKVVFQS
ncbi:MAG: amidohydrolase family protein, partial [Roseburia sp.]|nr:amidohydrolase family protein [Roseburia sp.]